MIDKDSILDTSWYHSLEIPIRNLIKQSLFLIDRERGLTHTSELHDHGYLVFPAAKALEGFLKSYFYQLGLISKKTFYNEYFRIGKALNPDLPKRFRDQEWLVSGVNTVCGQELADLLWKTWRQARNKVFHFRASQSEGISLEDAEDRVNQILVTIEAAVVCETHFKRE